MPTWVGNDAKWESAKAIVRKQYDEEEGSDRFWRLVTGVYEKMGGTVVPGRHSYAPQRKVEGRGTKAAKQLKKAWDYWREGLLLRARASKAPGLAPTPKAAQAFPTSDPPSFKPAAPVPAAPKPSRRAVLAPEVAAKVKTTTPKWVPSEHAHLWQAAQRAVLHKNPESAGVGHWARVTGTYKHLGGAVARAGETTPQATARMDAAKAPADQALKAHVTAYHGLKAAGGGKIAVEKHPRGLFSVRVSGRPKQSAITEQPEHMARYAAAHFYHGPEARATRQAERHVTFTEGYHPGELTPERKGALEAWAKRRTPPAARAPARKLPSKAQITKNKAAAATAAKARASRVAAETLPVYGSRTEAVRAQKQAKRKGVPPLPARRQAGEARQKATEALQARREKQLAKQTRASQRRAPTDEAGAIRELIGNTPGLAATVRGNKQGQRLSKLVEGQAQRKRLAKSWIARFFRAATTGALGLHLPAGAMRPGHKYIDRHRGTGGRWVYAYKEDPSHTLGEQETGRRVANILNHLGSAHGQHDTAEHHYDAANQVVSAFGHQAPFGALTRLAREAHSYQHSGDDADEIHTHHKAVASGRYALAEARQAKGKKGKPAAGQLVNEYTAHVKAAIRGLSKDEQRKLMAEAEHGSVEAATSPASVKAGEEGKRRADEYDRQADAAGAKAAAKHDLGGGRSVPAAFFAQVHEALGDTHLARKYAYAMYTHAQRGTHQDPWPSHSVDEKGRQIKPRLATPEEMAETERHGGTVARKDLKFSRREGSRRLAKDPDVRKLEDEFNTTPSIRAYRKQHGRSEKLYPYSHRGGRDASDTRTREAANGEVTVRRRRSPGGGRPDTGKTQAKIVARQKAVKKGTLRAPGRPAGTGAARQAEPQLAKLLRQGHGVREVARRTGLSPAAVSRAAGRLGITPRSTRGRTAASPVTRRPQTEALAPKTRTDAKRRAGTRPAPVAQAKTKAPAATGKKLPTAQQQIVAGHRHITLAQATAVRKRLQAGHSHLAIHQGTGVHRKAIKEIAEHLGVATRQRGYAGSIHGKMQAGTKTKGKSEPKAKAKAPERQHPPRKPLPRNKAPALRKGWTAHWQQVVG